MNTDRVCELFDNLDTWRHLPAYQLERRADIFFSLYLREVVSGELGVELADTMIPELPLKNTDNAQSTKADYFLLSADHTRAFIVELKTDSQSYNVRQNERLEQAARDGIATIVGDVLQVVLKSKAYEKYFRLVQALQRLGLVNVPTDLEDWVYKESRRGLVPQLRTITATALRPSVEVLYVVPQPLAGRKYITFETFARYVSQHSDPISQRFAQSLVRWQSAAGART